MSELQVLDGKPDRRKPAKPPRTLWFAEIAGTPAHPTAPRLVLAPHGGPERRSDADTMLALRQLWSLAKAGTLDGVALVALHRGGGQHLVVTGTAYDDSVRALGGLSRLRALLECHPSHPADFHDLDIELG